MSIGDTESEDAQSLTSEDRAEGVAGAILNRGPTHDDCTGFFGFESFRIKLMIDATAHFLTNVVMDYFETNHPLTE